MSYPRNAATPKAVEIGPLVKIADGSMLATTAGVAVRVDLDGGGYGAGAGTISVDATSGIFSYAPTQAETNGDVLRVALYIADYMSISANVIMDPLDLAVNMTKLIGTAPTEGAAGRLAAGMTKQWDVATPVFTAASVNQTADVGTRLPQVVTMAQVGGTGVYYIVALGSAGTGAGQFSLSSGVIAASGNWSTYAGADTAGITELLTRIPDATPGETGGLLIAGANAGPVSISGGLSVENAAGDAVTFTSTSIGGVGFKMVGGAGGTSMVVADGITGSLLGGITGDIKGKVLGDSASVLIGVGVQADVQTIKTQTVTATAGFSFDNLTTLIGKFTGITLLAKWLRGLFRKDAMDATAKGEVNDSGGTFNEATDSNEAIRDTAPLGTAMRGTDGAYTGTPPTADAIGTDAAAKILATPAQKIVTNASGKAAATFSAADDVTGAFTAEALANAPTGTGSGLTAQQTRDAMALALTPATPTPATGVDGRIIAVAANAAAPPLASATGALPAEAFANQPAATVNLTDENIQEIADDVVAGVSDELADIKAKTDLITSGTVIVNSPVASGGALTLTAGNAYTGALALPITAASYGDKALSGATHGFAIQTRTRYNQGDGFGTATGTVTAAISGIDLAYTVALTAAQTISLATNPPAQAPTHKYELKTTYTDGTIRRVIGDLTVSRGVTNE